jgi:hypothetical protein
LGNILLKTLVFYHLAKLYWDWENMKRNAGKYWNVRSTSTCSIWHKLVKL